MKRLFFIIILSLSFSCQYQSNLWDSAHSDGNFFEDENDEGDVTLAIAEPLAAEIAIGYEGRIVFNKAIDFNGIDSKEITCNTCSPKVKYEGPELDNIITYDDGDFAIIVTIDDVYFDVEKNYKIKLKNIKEIGGDDKINIEDEFEVVD